MRRLADLEGAGAMRRFLTVAGAIIAAAIPGNVTAGVAAPECFGMPATIVGTPNDDVLYGTPGADVIVSKGGDDRVNGRGARDWICVGPGNDFVHGGHYPIGKDSLKGGRGNDTLVGAEFHDVLIGGPGKDVLRGGAIGDTLEGGGGPDELYGGRGPDSFDGGSGNDACKVRDEDREVVSCDRLLP